MSSSDTSGEVREFEGNVTVRNAWLRELLAETIVRRHVGHYHPNDDIPIPRRFGTVRHGWRFSLPVPGGWFPVTSREVDEARLRSFRAGVTFLTYKDFHLLRRNYEADTLSLGKHIWLKVKRNPPPSLSEALRLFWTESGLSLIGFIDEFERMPALATAEPCEIRFEIRSILSDMCRPLRGTADMNAWGN